MAPENSFENDREMRLLDNAANKRLREAADHFMTESVLSKYSYNFSWLGRPIIQYPQDMLAMQEIIWNVKPDLIIETGIAHGGSLVYYASLLELIGQGVVLGIDIDIRAHNRHAIETHPMFKRISLLEGSSVSEPVLKKVRQIALDKSNVLVCLDSNHTHQHVLQELNLYSPLVTRGSYLVVFDTLIASLPEAASADRPWNRNKNPRTAVKEFLKTNKRFCVDDNIANWLLVTVAPDGYLKCIDT